MVIPNNIIYHQGNNPTQANLMLDRIYSVYGGSDVTPKGGMLDYIGELTLRLAISYQFEEELIWLHAIEFRFGKPFLMCEYRQSNWHFYPEGVPIND